MFNDQGIPKYLFWLVIAFTGAVIGYVRKHAANDVHKTVWGKAASLAFAVVTSMFMACLTYLAAKYYIDDHNLCVALAGVAAYGGTDALVACERALLKKIGGGETPERRQEDTDDING